MNPSLHPQATGRSCPRCQRRTGRVSRTGLDRLLSLFMPVVRYRCANPGCGWEGLLMRHPRPRRRSTRPPDASYRPQWLQPARLDGRDKSPGP